MFKRIAELEKRVNVLETQIADCQTSVTVPDNTLEKRVEVLESTVISLGKTISNSLQTIITLLLKK
ncbi:MAG: hypothetical protein PHD31_00125 [Candidatus Pacebacteria bacterium]|nr:hypothetical protein [Candidatus Paceibacterota bacterium]